VKQSFDRPSSRLREAVFESGAIAQVVFDAGDRLMFHNSVAAALFSLGAPERGKRLQDLEISYRPAELRTMFDRAREQRGPVVTEVSRAVANGDTQFFEVTITPLYQGSEQIGTSVTFDDVTRHRRMAENLQQFSENLETAYEELQSANEELETTNEELQSSNEELETTNEELQAANEEMETINEELRSTNEELQLANEQLRAREGDLDQANGFLRGILGSLSSGVAVVDQDLRIQVWNSRAEDLWGLRADEVNGQLFTGLDIGLPVAELADSLGAAMKTGQVVEVLLGAVNRRGRAVSCRVTISPLRGAEPAAATLLMDVLGTGGDGT
jgi:two-component system CheB/CheR fusion protein